MKREEFIETEENKNRRIEISQKLVKMGKSLIMEGSDNKDYCVISAGNLLVLISGLIVTPNDMEEFNKLCSMFSAKAILDDLMNSPLGAIVKSNLTNKLSNNLGPFNGNMDNMKDILDFLSNNDDE